MKVYLAGKISEYCWRRQLFAIDSDEIRLPEDEVGWPILKAALIDGHDCVGPYFSKGEDLGHGMYNGEWFGDNTHGNGICDKSSFAYHYVDHSANAQNLTSLCLRAIDSLPASGMNDGEWFHGTAELRRYIANNCTNQLTTQVTQALTNV